MWRAMRAEERDKYFILSRKVFVEHRRKYPGK
jgi:hypothetical protein